MIHKAATVILNALDCPDGELSLLIVDDSGIAALNQQYLNRTGPTNVIAFPMREGEFSMVTPTLLGDVVISADTAQREAEAADIPMEDRFLALLIHGVLHLFGYDHENDAAQAAIMEEKADELMHLIKQSQ
ncbi:MAG: rRNA maturation RNase YbeY [Desulfobacterales bacterium]|jgi:probable rRNA maturation factor|nr:rRNA maturation RNase YbeY [Desulfobacterales bacterium]